MSTNVTKILTAISKEFSRRFDCSANIVSTINHQYNKAYKAFGAGAGSSIEIVRPMNHTATRSVTMKIQDNEERTTTLQVNNDVHVALGFTASELSQDLEKPEIMKMFGDEYLQSAIDTIQTDINSQVAAFMAKNAYSTVGTAGTGPNAYSVVTDARARLQEFRAPKDGRYIALNPTDAALLNASQVSLFNPQTTVSSQFENGWLGRSNQFDFIDSPDIYIHTNGAGASYQVDGANQTGTSLLVKTGTGAMPAGTQFTLGKKAVDPKTKQVKSFNQLFTVVSDYAGGAGTVTIYPAIVTSGPYQNIEASPADSVALTIIGSASTAYGRNLFYQRDAFAFATCELPEIGVKYEVPIIAGGAETNYMSPGGANKGIYMRMYMDGDITNRRSVARLDCRWGVGVLVPEWSGVIQGK